MDIWQSVIITVLGSIFGGGGMAWIYLKLVIKDTATSVVKEKLKEKLKEYTTREHMQLERKELLEEMERRFLEKVAFREFEKRMDDKFADTDKKLDKIMENQEHIKDYIIQQKGF